MPITDSDVTWRPVIDSGRVFLLGTRFPVNAVETDDPAIVLRRIVSATGEAAWETEMEPRGSVPRLVFGDDVVLCVQGAAVDAVDSRNGELLWSVRYAHSPQLVGAGAGRFVALLQEGVTDTRDLRSGAHMWTLDVSGWSIDRFEVADGTLYAVADGTGDHLGEIGVFDTARPSALPSWHRRSNATAAATVVARSLLVGPIETMQDAAVRLSDGTRAYGAPSPASGSWVGDLRVHTSTEEGLALRLQRIDARRPGDSEPLWTAYLASGTQIISREAVLGGDGILVASETVAALVDAADGRVLWTVPIDAVDREGRTCTVAGATHGGVVMRCERFGDDVLVAVPAEQD